MAHARAVFPVTAMLLLSLAGTRAASARWVTQPTANPPHAMRRILLGVSCSSVRRCTAVGQYVSVSDGYTSELAESWNGRRWSIQRVAQPEGRRGDSTLRDVSCISSRHCIAVGSDDSEPLVESWNGTRWIIERVRAGGRPRSIALYGVTCASSSRCMVVGDYSYIDPKHVYPEHAIVISEADGRWLDHSVPQPRRAVTSDLVSVSCPSATRCTAVGYWRDDGGWHVLIERSHRGRWAIQRSPDVGHGYLLAVSCASSSRCVAVGGYKTRYGLDHTLVERWDGTRWSVQPSAGAPAVDSDLSGVSCPASNRCMAVGEQLNASGVVTTLTERWTGRSWSAQRVANAHGKIATRLRDLSCASARRCTAVGDAARRGGVTLAEVWKA